MADNNIDRRKAAEAARRYGVDPELYVRLIERESSFNPQALGQNGEVGFAQILGSTGEQPGYGVTPIADRSNPDENLRFGAEYLGALINKFEGNVRLALQAYNGGVGNVDNDTVSDSAKSYANDLLGGKSSLPTDRPVSRPDTVGGIESALKTLAESDGGSEADDYESAMAGLSMLTKAFSPRKVSPLKATSSVSRGKGGNPLDRFKGLASLRSN